MLLSYTKPKFDKKKLVKARYGRRYSEMTNSKQLMLSLADMDVLTPKAIINALKRRVSWNHLIYVRDQERMTKALTHWYKMHFGVELKPEYMIYGNGVLHIVDAAIIAYSNPGDGIILNTPAYGSFLNIINEKYNNRKQICSHLDWNPDTQRFENNWARLEKLFADKKNKIFVSCSPHNPIGRVWSKEELKKLVSLALKHNVFIISDEIWQDFCFSHHKHTPMVFACKDAPKCCVTISSPLKTFNINSLQFGYAIAPDKKVHEKISKVMENIISYSSDNPLTYTAVIEGYMNPTCEQWRKNLIKHLERNFEYFKTNIESKTNISVYPLEGSFVCWVDFSKVVKTREELVSRLKKIKVVTTSGPSHGGEKFNLCERLNIGVSYKDIKTCTSRLIEEFGKK